MSLSCETSPAPVRDDLVAAHGHQWTRLAQPGTWWTGAQRVTIAREVRRAVTCELCRKRKAALSPYAVEGNHEGNEWLPEAVVDVIHRVTTDPGRLTKAWFDSVIASGATCEEYVETIGVIVTVFSIDSFCRGMGVSLHPLPEPVEGEPSHYRPAAARMDKAWVPLLPAGRLGGSEADLWVDIPAGRAPYVLRALSLVPDEVRALKALSAAHYLSPAEMMNLQDSPRAIDRQQIELIAGRVSALRGCFY